MRKRETSKFSMKNSSRQLKQKSVKKSMQNTIWSLTSSL